MTCVYRVEYFLRSSIASIELFFGGGKGEIKLAGSAGVANPTITLGFLSASPCLHSHSMTISFPLTDGAHTCRLKQEG